MTTRQCWESMCLLEETMRLSIPRLSQVPWQPEMEDLADVFIGGSLCIKSFATSLPQELVKLGTEGQAREGQTFSSSIRVASVTLTLVKTMRLLPPSIRKTLFTYVPQRWAAQ